MLWPRPRSLSALCPPCVRHVSALCPPCVHLESASAAPPNLVRHMSAMCPLCVTVWPPCVRHASALCPPLSTTGPPCFLLKPPPLDFVRSWPAVGQGRGIIKQNSFSPLRNPQRLYCMPVGQFPWHSFWFPKFGLCKRTLCLKNSGVGCWVKLCISSYGSWKLADLFQVDWFMMISSKTYSWKGSWRPSIP